MQSDHKPKIPAVLIGLLAAIVLTGIFTAISSEMAFFHERKYTKVQLETTLNEPLPIHIIQNSQSGQGSQSDQPEAPGGPAVRLLFGGDVYFSEHVLRAYEQAGGINGVLGESLLAHIGQADLFMVNQEFPFSHRGEPAKDKQFTFRLPAKRVSLLNEMGVDLVTLANNHALDYGREALADTFAALDSAQVRFVGAGRDLDQARQWQEYQINHQTIGFLGATRVIPVWDWAAAPDRPGMLSTYDPEMLIESIRAAKEACDYVVVYVHWGVEKAEFPEAYQRELGKSYIDAGADVVIGSHPHVLQGIEFYRDKPIVYSLGNFVFGSSIPRTALLSVWWEDEQPRLQLVPAFSAQGYTKEVVEAEKRKAFFAYIESISDGVTVDGEGNVLNR